MLISVLTGIFFAAYFLVLLYYLGLNMIKDEPSNLDWFIVLNIFGIVVFASTSFPILFIICLINFTTAVSMGYHKELVKEELSQLKSKLSDFRTDMIINFPVFSESKIDRFDKDSEPFEINIDDQMFIIHIEFISNIEYDGRQICMYDMSISGINIGLLDAVNIHVYDYLITYFDNTYCIKVNKTSLLTESDSDISA
jgi:hypothetical protein